jgi:hypothetical protein
MDACLRRHDRRKLNRQPTLSICVIDCERELFLSRGQFKHCPYLTNLYGSGSTRPVPRTFFSALHFLQCVALVLFLFLNQRPPCQGDVQVI